MENITKQVAKLTGPAQVAAMSWGIMTAVDLQKAATPELWEMIDLMFDYPETVNGTRWDEKMIVALNRLEAVAGEDGFLKEFLAVSFDLKVMAYATGSEQGAEFVEEIMPFVIKYGGELPDLKKMRKLTPSYKEKLFVYQKYKLNRFSRFELLAILDIDIKSYSPEIRRVFGYPS